MCDICMSFPHHPRCPNAPEPPTVFVCAECGQSIYDGEDYYDVLGEQFHTNCIDGMRRTAEYDPY